MEYKVIKINDLSVERFKTELWIYLKKKKLNGEKVTQAKLCEKMNVTTQFMSMLKNGDRRLTNDMAEKFAKEFEVIPEYLLGLTDNKHFTQKDYFDRVSLQMKEQTLLSEYMAFLGYEIVEWVDSSKEKYNSGKYEGYYLVKTPNGEIKELLFTKFEKMADEFLISIKKELEKIL